ncbi:MAG TPA: MBG domain-containing protein [Acidimicrobiales bacterium]
MRVTSLLRRALASALVLAATSIATTLTFAPSASASTPCGTTGTFTSPSTCSYTTSGEGTFTVPAGVTSLHLVANGSAGHSSTSPGGHGGAGAQVKADIPVTSGSSEYVEVGVGGGGGGTYGGGAGGGLSGIYTCSGHGTTANCALVVGGGGGGGGYYGQPNPTGGYGGAGGSGALLCNSGANGFASSGNEGTSAGGAGGACSAGGAGGAGLPSAGGAGGAGTGGTGGTGSYPGAQAGAGGGGGGYYGGGGGGGGDYAGGGYSGGGGGGGGSSFAESSASNLSVGSAPGTPSVSITWSVAPPATTVTCSTNGNIFNTGYNASTGGVLPNNSLDANWTVSGPFNSPSGTSPANAVSLPPSGATFLPANVGDLAPTAYSPSPYGNAQWISQQTIANPSSPTGDWYYEYQFALDPAVSPAAFSLDMNFLADNEVAQVFVNGVAQSFQTTGLPQSSDPSFGGTYSYHGYYASNEASTVLDHNWQAGLNTIIVQVKSGAPAEAFDAQMRVASVCAASAPTITNIPGTAVYQGGFTAVVSTNGDGPLSVTSTTPSVCTATGLTVTYVGAGTCTLVAHVGQGTVYGPNSGAPQSFTVNPSAATVTVSASSPAAITYGASAPAVSASYSGLLGGDSSIAGVTCSVTGYSVGSSAGTYTTTCTGPPSTADYSNINYATGSLTVDPVPLTITASSETSTYGSTPGAISASYSGLVNGDLAPSTLPTCSTVATASSSVGSYATTCSGAADPNYTISYVKGADLVTPATLTVTANDAARVYDMANPTFTATYSGFVNGDTSSSVAGTANCSTTATVASSVGTYPISCAIGSLSSENYVFTFANGSLAIAPMPTTLVITSSPTLLNGVVRVTASVTENLTGNPVNAGTVTFSAGASSATANAPGFSAQLTLVNGVYTLNAVFGADSNYVGSSSSQTLYAYQAANFVVWGANSAGVKIGADLNFWGSQWSKQVTGGSYGAGASFKGYASSVNSIAKTWSTSPGNSSVPPTSVAQYIGVIVTTNATKSGSTISGNIAEIVILKVDNPAGYSNDPGHPASGVVQSIVS